MNHSNQTNYDPSVIIDAIDLATNQRIADARKRKLSKRAEEIAFKEADEAKKTLRQTVISYDTATPSELITARRPEKSHKVIRIRASIGEMTDPIQVEIPRDQGTIMDLIGASSEERSNNYVTSLLSCITICGEGNDRIKTEPFMDRKLINCLQDQANRFANWEFLLYVVPATCSEKETGSVGMSQSTVIYRAYHFYLIDARPLTSAIQVVSPTPGEIESCLQLYGSHPNVFEFASEKVIRLLNVQCLDHLPVLSEAIRFQVLAAATEGQRGHTLVIGPPGVGKSLIHKCAKLVQPVFKHAMPTKVTEAGLIGDGYSNAKQRRPGLLPQSHTGAFSVEDFNQANQIKNQRFCAAFTDVMAKGTVADASAAKTEYKTEVSIILDANRKSDVRRRASDKQGFDLVVDDIGIPMNIFSRATYIAEIPRDTETQLKVSQAIVNTHGTLSEVDTKMLEEEIRQLQVFLALMREKYPRISIPKTVTDYINQRTAEVNNMPTTHFELHAEFADFLARQGKQAIMLVEAHARMHNRGVAELTDVDAIFPFLWRKIDWIKSTLFGGQAQTDVVDANARARRALIKLGLRTWSSTTCTPRQVQRHLGLQSASLATIEDDLRFLLAEEPNEKGEFKVVIVERNCA
jgi:hypothetical protein